MGDSETRLDVKILVDKEKSRVLFAEADGDFVDILFSFLTLPLGTIVRLIGKSRSDPTTLGSFSTLYQSVMSLGDECFRAEELREMLLHPRSSSEFHLQGLKINIDDTEAKYFTCPNNNADMKVSMRLKIHYLSCSMCMSIYKNTICPNCCEKSMSTLISLEDSSKGNIFVGEAVRFIITDELVVKPVVPGTVIDLINNLGISDMSVIEERTVKLGSNELLELLKWSLLSTTPLTDLFLSKKKLPGVSVPKEQPREINHCADNSGEARKMNVKVVLKKSNKEFLFLEAGKDFTEFLFSLLVVPLAEMLHIMEGRSCVGSLDGLYKSVLSLDSKYFISEHQKNILMRPKLPPPFIWKNHLFPLESTPISFFIEGLTRKMPVHCEVGGVPKSGEFLKGQTSFFVSDNLEFTPLSAVSSFSILSRNKVSVSDLEERTLSLGMEEGISLLRASLNSTSAISNGLLRKSLVFKEPKQEK